MSWFGHVHQMTYDRVVKKLYEWKLIPTRLAGTPNIRWENDIKEDLRIMNLNNCIKYSYNQDQVKWKEVVEKAKTFTQ